MFPGIRDLTNIPPVLTLSDVKLSKLFPEFAAEFVKRWSFQMPVIISHEIDTLPKFVDVIELIKTKVKGPVWYRGIKNSAFTLQPSLYRNSDFKSIEDYVDLEQKLIDRFSQRSIPFHSRVFKDEWDLLFFMQHFGIPTRLLDWTENPFVALFFAVMNSSYTIDGKKIIFSNDAVVWALDPISWNRHALSYKTFTGGILSQIDHDLSGYKPPVDYRHMNNHPVAMFGAHNSQRIVAQRGVFTVFGKKLEPMEKLLIDDAFPDDALQKIIIKKGVIAKLRNDITNYGITDSVIFPDLDGLAREIKREYNFEV